MDEAIDQYQKALKINPNYVAAHYNFGLALMRRGLRPPEGGQIGLAREDFG